MLQLIDKKNRWIVYLGILFFLTTFNLPNSNFVNLFFQIKSVEYNKTLFIKESLKAKEVDLLIDKNLFLLNKKNIKNLFFQNEWVESVVFKKKFPNKLYIYITEYFPVGYYKLKNKIYLINSNYSSSLFVNNIDLQHLIEFENIKKIKELEIFVNKLNLYNKILSKIKKIKYIHVDRWDVILKNDQLIKFGSYNLEEQAAILKLILKDKKISMVDLRSRGQLVVSYGK
jgi:cell division septal protein FtsQ